MNLFLLAPRLVVADLRASDSAGKRSSTEPGTLAGERSELWSRKFDVRRGAEGSGEGTFRSEAG